MFAKFFKKAAKDFLVEAVSLGAAYVTNIFLDPEDSKELWVNLISLRVYYTAKNILYFIDAHYNKTPSEKHVYAGSFNLGVAATLYPAIKFIGMTYVGERMAAATVVCASGLLLRGVIEKPHAKQTLQMHLQKHRGNLVGDVLGVFVSGIKGAGIASVSLHWGGEGVDNYLNRSASQTLTDVAISAPQTVPFQVVVAALLKVILTTTNQLLPFPSYFLDFLLGCFYKVMVHVRENFCLTQNASIDSPLAVPISEIKISVRNESASIENSSLALTQLMSRGTTTIFHVPVNSSFNLKNKEIVETVCNSQ